MQTIEHLQRIIKFYEKVLRVSNDGILITDANQNIIEVNDAFCSFIGQSRKEVIDSNLFSWLEMFSEEAVEHWSEVEKEVQLHKNVKNFEFQLHINKETKYFSINISQLDKQDDEEQGILISNWHDITNRKIAEKALKDSEKKYRELIEKMTDGIYISTHEGKFVEVNKAMVDILGYDSKEELLEIDIKTQLYFEEKERESADLEEMLEEMAIFRLKKKDGTEIWVEDHGRHVVDEHGEILYHEGSLRDVTERKLANDKLERKSKELIQLNAEKDKFFSIIAHDLKSPFNGILGFSGLLAEKMSKKEYEGIEKYAKIIHASANHSMDLLTNLMEWASSQTGKMKFNPQYFEMTELISEVIDLLKISAKQKSISITKDIPVSVPIYADKDMINTVLRNLISNAIKFTNINGEVNISIQEKQGYLKLSVRDNGIGISRDNIGKLFRIEGNFSVPGTMDEKGTGLGLILCGEFIKAHKGKIWAESIIGKGSTFTFTIPNNSEFDVLT